MRDRFEDLDGTPVYFRKSVPITITGNRQIPIQPTGFVVLVSGLRCWPLCRYVLDIRGWLRGIPSFNRLFHSDDLICKCTL